jgi:hypothetical protein
MQSINPIYYCLPRAVEVLKQTREQFGNNDTRAGINYMLVMASACYLEAVMERGLTEIIQTLPPSAHPTDACLRRDLLSRIRQAQGINDYKELFLLATGVPLHELEHVKTHWEGLQALFALRNVLAHGRAITARIVFPPDEAVPWSEEYEGNYRKVHEYLLKCRVLTAPVDPTSLEWFCLESEVADHFWTLTYNAVVYIGESLDGKAAEAFKMAVYSREQAALAKTLPQS